MTEYKINKKNLVWIKDLLNTVSYINLGARAHTFKDMSFFTEYGKDIEENLCKLFSADQQKTANSFLSTILT